MHVYLHSTFGHLSESYGECSTRKGNKFYKCLAYNFWHPAVFKQTFWPFRLGPMPVLPSLSGERAAPSLILQDHWADQKFYSENTTFFKWYNSQCGSCNTITRTVART